jgi:hypothetical protein
LLEIFDNQLIEAWLALAETPNITRVIGDPYGYVFELVCCPSVAADRSLYAEQVTCRRAERDY